MDDARRLAVQRRIPDDSLPRSQRLQRQLLDRRRHRPPRRGAPRTQSVSCRSATTSTGRARSAHNVEAARAAGVNLAFFSGNESVLEDAVGDEHRRHQHAPTHAGLLQGNAREREDRSRRRRGPARGATRASVRRPTAAGRKTALTGTIFTVNGSGTTRHRVPAAFSALRFWRNTAVANLQPGQTRDAARRHARLRVGLRPRQRFAAGRSDRSVVDRRRPSVSVLQDYGSTYGAGTAIAQPHAVSPRAVARSSSAPAPCSGRGDSTATTTAATTDPASTCSRRR